MDISRGRRMDLKIFFLLVTSLAIQYVNSQRVPFTAATYGGACDEGKYKHWRKGVVTYPEGSFKHGLYLEHKDALDKHLRGLGGGKNPFAQSICLTSLGEEKEDKIYSCLAGKCTCHSSGEFTAKRVGSNCILVKCATCFKASQCENKKCLIKPGRNFYQCFDSAEPNEAECQRLINKDAKPGEGLGDNSLDDKDFAGWKTC